MGSVVDKGKEKADGLGKETGIFNGKGSSSSSSGFDLSGGSTAESHDMSADGKEKKFEYSEKSVNPHTNPHGMTETKGPKEKEPYKNVGDQFADNVSVDVDFFSEEHEAYLNQIGNDEAHVNFGHAEFNVSSGMEITKNGIEADLISMDAKVSAVHGEFDKSTELMGGYAEVGASGEVDLLSAELGVDVGATVDWEKGEVSANAGGEAGAYLASVEGEVDGSFTIPILGVTLGGHVGGEANVGVGAEASVEGGMTKEKGLYFSTTLGASLGPGAKADVGGSIGLAEEGLVPWVVDNAPEIAREIGETTEAVIDGAADLVQDLGSSAVDLAEDIGEGAKNVKDSIGNFFKSFGDDKDDAKASKSASKKSSSKGKG